MPLSLQLFYTRDSEGEHTARNFLLPVTAKRALLGMALMPTNDVRINQDERELFEGGTEPRLGRCLVMLEHFRIWCRENPFTCGVTNHQSGAQLTEDQVYFAARSPNGDVIPPGGLAGVWLFSGFEEPRVEKTEDARRPKVGWLAQDPDYVSHSVMSIADNCEFKSEVEPGSTDPCYVLFRCMRTKGVACLVSIQQWMRCASRTTECVILSRPYLLNHGRRNDRCELVLTWGFATPR